MATFNSIEKCTGRNDRRGAAKPAKKMWNVLASKLLKFSLWIILKLFHIFMYSCRSLSFYLLFPIIYLYPFTFQVHSDIYLISVYINLLLTFISVTFIIYYIFCKDFFYSAFSQNFHSIRWGYSDLCCFVCLFSSKEFD